MIKITIEGLEDKPEVLEVEEYILVTNDESDTDIKSNSFSDHVFLGYASSLIHQLFKERMAEED